MSNIFQKKIVLSKRADEKQFKSKEKNIFQKKIYFDEINFFILAQKNLNLPKDFNSYRF